MTLDRFGTSVKAAVIGVGQGVGGSALIFLTSETRTLANDWFLAVMLIFATTTTNIVAARFAINLFGVAIAGLFGMMVGGWVGKNVIGSYEYSVPTPQQDREIRIITPGKERVIELKDVPETTVKRVPVGGGVGVLVGWAVGAISYGAFTHRRDSTRKMTEHRDANHDE